MGPVSPTSNAFRVIRSLRQENGFASVGACGTNAPCITDHRIREGNCPSEFLRGSGLRGGLDLPLPKFRKQTHVQHAFIEQGAPSVWRPPPGSTLAIRFPHLVKGAAPT